MSQELVPAANFCVTLAANIDNEKLSDAEFRQFVRNSIAIVDYPRAKAPQPFTLESDTEVRAAFVVLEAYMPEHHKAMLSRLMHMCVEGERHSFKHRETRKGFEFDPRFGSFSTEDREGRLTDPDEVLRWIASED